MVSGRGFGARDIARRNVAGFARVESKEKPRCQLEIVTQHLGEREQRQQLFERLNQQSQNAIVISEGLLIYLDEEKVTTIAADLHAQPHFKYWIVEITSPKVLEFINRKWGRVLQEGNCPMAFAPADWRKFYRDLGWEVEEFVNNAKTAREVNREPGIMKFFRKVGEVFPSWGAKQRSLWESGMAILRRA